MISRKALPLTSAALLIFNALISPVTAIAAGPGKSLHPANADSTASSQPKTPSFRLPSTVQPVSYKLSFDPDLTAGKFSGHEEIVLTVEKSTPELVLHNLEEKITDAYVEDGKSAKIPVKSITADAVTEQVHLKLGSTLAPGTYTFHCHFDGILNDKLRGFYRSKYKDASGAEHYMATTQMEPTDARRMFPCFDEPAFKATYQISCLIDKDLTAISNAAVQSSEERDNKKKLVSFAPSPKMSSYLVALVIGPLKGTEPVVVDGVPIRVWSVGDKVSQLALAQEVACKLLPYYNSYFGTKYADTKLDLIAIPDFEAGAMENLGAITFRDVDLVFEEKTGSMLARMRVTSIIAHEMAHMWFGDLVTMKWWDDLWLNEAFATWMASKAVDQLKPEWHYWDDFAMARTGALETDSLVSAKAIHTKVIDASQANEMFDGITYTKGASILRMLEKFITEDTFREGIRNYIAKHKFNNATTGDLWAALSLTSKRDIGSVMKTWTEYSGYPLISSKQLGADNLELQQKRFVLVPEAATATPRLWQVPVVVRGINAPEKVMSSLLAGQSTDLHTNFVRAPFVINAGGNGYYRSQYTSAELNALEKGGLAKLSVPERISLVSDSWALTLSGKQPVADFLSLAKSLRGEENVYVQTALIQCYDGTDERGNFNSSGLWSLSSDKSLPSMERFICDQLRPLKEKLGWQTKPNEDDLTKLLRAKVLRTLGIAGQDKQTIAEARQLFQQYLDKPDSVDPGSLKAITEVVAFNGDLSTYEQVLKLYHTATTPEMEHINLDALALFHDPKIVEKALALSLTKDVRTQDAPHFLKHELINRYNKVAAWKFITANWAKIREKFNENLVQRIIGGAESFTSTAMEKELKDFVSTHPVPRGARTVAETLEVVRANNLFVQRSGAQLADWLTDYSKKTASADASPSS
jgi:puromycin-sensitive aminopeptidase